jgi:hypothetical protein
MQSVDCVRNHNRLLAFGDLTGISGSYGPYVPAVESGAGSVLSPAAAALVHSAAFGNVCNVLKANGAVFDTEDCEDFVGGVMKEGNIAVTEVCVHTKILQHCYKTLFQLF